MEAVDGRGLTLKPQFEPIGSRAYRHFRAISLFHESEGITVELCRFFAIPHQQTNMVDVSGNARIWHELAFGARGQTVGLVLDDLDIKPNGSVMSKARFPASFLLTLSGTFMPIEAR